MDYKALREEINTDPAKVGYAAILKTGSDAGIPEALNTPTTTLISRGMISKDDFAFLFSWIALRIIGLPNPLLIAKWQWAWKVVTDNNRVNMDGNDIAQARAMAIADGLCTAEEWDGIALQAGTRAEILFGAGVVITAYDVAQAMKVEGA